MLLYLAAIFGGVQFLWAIQIGNVTPYLIELGVSRHWVAIIWLCGPISGVLMQPLIGALSDRHSSTGGHRRPFIIVSAFVTAFCAIVFAWSKRLGAWWGHDTPTSHPTAIKVAICSFWSLDFSINATMVVVRALLTDVVPRDGQAAGNAMFSTMISVGNMVGYGFGAFSWHSGGNLSNIEVLFTMGGVLVVCTSFFTLMIPENGSSGKSESEVVVAADDDAAADADLQEGDDEAEALLNSSPTGTSAPRLDVLALLKTPAARRLYRVWIVQVCTFLAWFCIFMFGSAWIAIEILHGDPKRSPSLYADGVRIGNLGFFMQASVAACASVVLPSTLTKYGYRNVWFVPTFVLAVTLMCSTLIHSIFAALLAFSLCGFAWATTMTVPWTLASISVHNTAHKGMYLALLNVSHCVPEIVASLLSSLLLSSLVGASMAIVLTCGGLSALGASILILTIPFDDILLSAKSDSSD